MKLNLIDCFRNVFICMQIVTFCKKYGKHENQRAHSTMVSSNNFLYPCKVVSYTTDLNNY